MKGVKDDLGKQKTAIATQTEQKRIVEQLQAMIDNLVEHHDQSKFAQDSNQNGGGGQGQSKGGRNRLPPEAELKLTQALQRAVNGATKVLGEQKEKDKPKLLALGNRQGELRGVLGQLLENPHRARSSLVPSRTIASSFPKKRTTSRSRTRSSINSF